MNPRKLIGRLEMSACKRLTKLQNIAASLPSSGMPPPPVFEPQICYATIEAANTWSNFSRAFYLSCAFEGRCGTSGRIVNTTKGLTHHEALSKAIQIAKPGLPVPSNGVWHRRDEPAWHDHALLRRTLNNIGCSKVVELDAVASMGSRVLIDLPVFRNYFAHRNVQTERAAKSAAPYNNISATYRPSQILLTVPVGGTFPLLTEWLYDLIFIVQYLCN
jgi:hypothetical protein